MINTEKVFERLDLGTSRVTSVIAVRTAIDDEAESNKKAKAEDLIFQLLGVKVVYEDQKKARFVAMKVAEEAWKVNHKIDDEQMFLHDVEVKIDAFMTNPNNAFMFVKPESYSAEPTEMKAVVAGVDTEVAIKKDGSIKKGGKEVLARELYKKHVLESNEPLSNQGFIAVLIKDLGMSKAGATTYAYNCKKALGEPEGGIVKSKKGRKAKQ